MTADPTTYSPTSRSDQHTAHQCELSLNSALCPRNTWQAGQDAGISTGDDAPRGQTSTSREISALSSATASGPSCACSPAAATSTELIGSAGAQQPTASNRECCCFTGNEKAGNSKEEERLLDNKLSMHQNLLCTYFSPLTASLMSWESDNYTI